MPQMVMGIFDVHINSDHHWLDQRMIKLDAYMLVLDDDRKYYKTNNIEPLASVCIPAGPFDVVDVWIDTKEPEKLKELPPFVQHAYSAVVEAASKAQRVFPINVKEVV